MARYRVTLCATVWENYTIDVDADDEDQAEEKATDRLMGKGGFADLNAFPPLDPDNSEGVDIDCIDCEEITDA